MWRILWGPEARAVRLALWIAVIDQAMASTAIINYAPNLIQQTSNTSNVNATLWTSSVTGAKVRIRPVLQSTLCQQRSHILSCPVRLLLPWQQCAGLLSVLPSFKASCWVWPVAC